VAKDDIDPEDMEEIESEEDLELDEDFEEDDFEEDSEDLDGDGDDGDMGATVVRKAGDDDEDDDDLLAPDDVEADLDTILKDRLASENEPGEDEEEVEPEDRSSSDEALQPKRADEVVCSACFLIVRNSAPNCPVGDEACPIFVR